MHVVPTSVVTKAPMDLQPLVLLHSLANGQPRFIWHFSGSNLRFYPRTDELPRVLCTDEFPSTRLMCRSSILSRLHIVFIMERDKQYARSSFLRFHQKADESSSTCVVAFSCTTLASSRGYTYSLPQCMFY